MTDLVTYEQADGVATITMDDGKVNALSPAMFEQLNTGLDKAEIDKAAVVLAGRERVLSGGFDLNVLRGGGPAAVGMLKSGFRLSERLLTFPTPVVIACPGNAVAMGVFLLLSADYRVGAKGEFKLCANEVAIGMTMPRAAVEVCRQRLTPAVYNRAIILAEPFNPEAGLAAGFLDQLVEPAEVIPAAQAFAQQLTGLNMPAHAASKLRARAQMLEALRAAMTLDDAEYDSFA